MSRYINADELMSSMYHEVFETDTDMQKWDSGCWIRYKMFENAIDSAPTIDAVSVVRCKECKHRHTPNCFRAYLEYDIQEWIVDSGDDNDFCSWGEREDE